MIVRCSTSKARFLADVHSLFPNDCRQWSDWLRSSPEWLSPFNAKSSNCSNPNRTLHGSFLYMRGDILGLTVYAHGSPNGAVGMPGKWTRNTYGRVWIWPQSIIDSIRAGQYKLKEINMMQCYSARNREGKNWQTEWNTVANRFYGYSGRNFFGLDLGWKVFPWNWFW